MSRNLAVVFGLLHDDGPSSRADLARATGLTKATVSSLVGELAELGLVHEVTGPVPGRTGRPATLVAVAGRSVAAIGLEVTVNHLRAAAVDVDGTVHHDETVDGDHASPADVVTRLGAMTARTAAALTREGVHVVGTGLAVPGLVSQPDGVILVAPNLGWDEVPLTEQLTRRLRRRGVDAGPVVTDNEANTAALAHLGLLRARGVRSYLTISGGVGVGAGVVIDGALFRGAHGFGGELGHFVVEPGGRRCRCGNRGCLETVAGEGHLRRLTGLRARAGDRWLDTLVERAGAGDRRTLDGLATVATGLTVALAAAVNFFDPEAVVLAGYLAPLAPWLTPAIRRSLADQVLGDRWAPIPVLASPHGPSAAVLGAAHLAMAPLLADPAAVGRAADASAT